jgi:hypothetical protein
MIDELLGRGGTCPSTGETAARANKVMDDLLEGFYGTRADRFWEQGSRTM